MRILIVDDHELVREGLRLRIEREKDLAVVAQAADADTAYTAVVQHSPDLVVLDLDLPDDDGISATTRIRALAPKTQVLILTGSKPGSIARAALLAGANGVVFKSEAADELLRAIRAIASGRVFLSPDAATAIAAELRAGIGSTTTATGTAPQLSARERTVLRGLANGLACKEIAAELAVSVKTVDTYRARLAKKLGCDSRADLVRAAIRLGLAQA